MRKTRLALCIGAAIIYPAHPIIYNRPVIKGRTLGKTKDILWAYNYQRKTC